MGFKAHLEATLRQQRTQSPLELLLPLLVSKINKPCGCEVGLYEHTARSIFCEYIATRHYPAYMNLTWNMNFLSIQLMRL